MSKAQTKILKFFFALKYGYFNQSLLASLDAKWNSYVTVLYCTVLGSIFFRNVDKFSPAPSSENEGVLPKLPVKLLMSSNAPRKRTHLSLAYHIGATHRMTPCTCAHIHTPYTHREPQVT